MNRTRRFVAGLGALVLAGLPASGMAAIPEPVSVASPPGADTVDPARLAIGRQIIAIMFPPEKRDAMMTSMLDSFLAQYRASITLPKGFDDPGLKKIMEDAFTSIPARLKPALNEFLPKMGEAMAHAYTREFSVEELKDILAFARTSAGQHYLQRSTALLGDRDVAVANTAYLTQVHQLSEQVKTDVRRAVVAYLQLHPDVAAKLNDGANPAK